MASDKMKYLRLLVSEFAEDDDIVSALNYLQTRTAFITAAIGVSTENRRNTSAHVNNYVEEVVPMYADLQFREHFRMRRSTVQDLCEWLGPYFPRERTITVEKKLLATIWLLSNKESFRGVADRFGLSKGRLHKIVMMVCNILSDHRQDVFKWPTPIEMQQNEQRFSERSRLQGVVGLIDGTHIDIPGPSKFRDSYINRHGTASMQLQVVCNPDLLFIDVYTGWPGSVHDSRVFRNSPLKIRLEEGGLPSRYHLLGDSAYQLTTYMMVPFRDNGHLTAVEKNYNKAHSSTRVEVERAIGLLKGKFRRLKYLEMYKVGSMPFVIFAACVLHNFIILKNGIDEDDIEMIAVGNDEEEGLIEARVAHHNESAIDKRNELAFSLV